MDPKLALLKTPRDEAAISATELLREHLERAHGTPIASAVVLTVDREGNIELDYITDSRIRLIGMLDFLKTNIAMEQD